MNPNPRRKRGLLTGLVAAATAVMLAFSVAAPAHAADPVTIDPAAKGSLIIHKFEQPDDIGDPSTGLEQVTTGLTPLAGIKFTAQQVGGIDLTENAGWEAAGNLTVAQAAAAVTGPLYESDATDATGLATIGGLPVGLYYVTETTFGPDVTPAVPFVVSIPMTNPVDLSTWNYNVHVYPKNATTTAEKSVEDADAVKIGDTIEWTVLADIPKSQAITRYEIQDVVDPKLELTGAVVSLTGAPGVTLVAADYNVSAVNPATITFTQTGRTKLEQAWQTDPNSRVQIVVSTIVKEIGEISNTATVFVNDSNVGFDTNTVITKWGNLVLEKVNAKNANTKLENAEFQVYLTKADAEAKTNPISIGGSTTFKSNSDGIVLIEGLRYSNWENGVAVAEGDANYRWYWIAETTAPEGYEMLAQPIRVDVTSDSKTIVTDVVKNVPKNAGFTLPLTGASGATVIIMIAGVLLLVVGITAVVVSRRKQSQAKA